MGGKYKDQQRRGEVKRTGEKEMSKENRRGGGEVER